MRYTDNPSVSKVRGIDMKCCKQDCLVDFRPSLLASVKVTHVDILSLLYNLSLFVALVKIQLQWIGAEEPLPFLTWQALRPTPFTNFKYSLVIIHTLEKNSKIPLWFPLEL